jgi:hypothetical protein
VSTQASGWTASSICLAGASILLIGTGCYFWFLRQPLLPEDVRYIGLTGQLDVVRPALESWLTQVFRVMGGYIVATGALALTLAVTSFREHQPAAAIGVSIGGIVSIGLMAVVNFIIKSDFKWVLFGMALVWAVSWALFWFGDRASEQTRGERGHD